MTEVIVFAIAVAGGFFGAGLGYMATLIGGAAVGMAGGEAALAMATAISVQEAVALGVALGVASAVASGGSNIHYSKHDPGMTNKSPVSGGNRGWN